MIMRRIGRLLSIFVLVLVVGVFVWHEFIAIKLFPVVDPKLCGSLTIFKQKLGADVPGYVEPSKNRQVVIFIHGIRADGTNTWTNDKGQYWPALLKSDAKDWDVYVSQYQDSIPIEKVATFLELDLGRVIESHERVFIVAHSMGGLVAREFLVRNPKYAPKVAGMFFLATPSLGSAIANFASRLGIGNKQSDDLRTIVVNPFLQKQRENWNKLDLHIPTNCAYETRKTWLFEVVNEESAQELCTSEAMPLDASHSTIAKPDCLNSYQETLLVSYLHALPELPPDEISATFKFEGPLIVGMRDDGSVIFNMTKPVLNTGLANKQLRVTSFTFKAKVAPDAESAEPFLLDVELLQPSIDVQVATNSSDSQRVQEYIHYADNHAMLHFSIATNVGARPVPSAEALVAEIPLHNASADRVTVYSSGNPQIDVGSEGLKLHLFIWSFAGRALFIKFSDVEITMHATAVR